jgi:heme-degrading monooxygenase HmoA
MAKLFASDTAVAVTNDMARTAAEQGGHMICRNWHGWTKLADADAYQSYLRDDLYPRLARELGDRGYRGHHVLRRTVDDEVEFVTMTWFESLDSVRGFAGEDYETPVITDTAARLLDRYDAKVAHFDLADEDARW